MISNSNILIKIDSIIGNSKKGISGVFPVSHSSWYAGIKAGKYPAPVKLGSRSVAWKLKDIEALLEKASKGGL